VRNDGSRRVSAIVIHHDLDAIGSQHLEDAGKGRLGQSMCIHTQVQRAGNTLHLAVFVNGLCNSHDMDFVKASLEGCAPMSRCSKRYALFAYIRIRLFCIVRRDQTRNVDEHGCRRRATCKRMSGHEMILWLRRGAISLSLMSLRQYLFHGKMINSRNKPRGRIERLTDGREEE